MRVSWLLVGLLIASSGCAAIKKQFSKEPPRRISVLELRGVKGLEVRRAIEGTLGDNTVVVPRAEYKQAARRLRAKRLRPRDVAKVAAELNLDVVIHGKRHGRNLRLVVRDGETGKVVAKHRIRLRKRRRLAPKDEETLAAELPASLQKVARAQAERKQEADEQRRIAEQDERDEQRRQQQAQDKLAAEERAAEDARIAQEEQKRQAEAEQKKQAEAKKKAEEEPPVAPVVYDNSGQAVDDEMPDVLGK